MCLAIPGQVKELYTLLDGEIRMAKVSFGGVIKEISLEMLDDVQVNDYVLVHVGLAISKVDEDEAQQVFGYLKQMGELDELEPE
ncbi:MAG: HypC/HybG/HupF family hydrogenase formation chaperone [Calditrichaeota bacterium]|nr:HypC/HybG/HupF family hydrogenase formation chaperone [Calditrichota bacterium]MCB0270090.1 HypC/HybG/HupF family hydrogenase formation chaperone [Calditrichota bacterium]MCB0299345.1 HypC/HybG/HupF family hydrogenase formation chaperone [Calditrichota bacterium]MCB9069686.1 HypC/HybG/HupF family hydrogenase formation chaperone [Calditrichia bacterium]